MEDYTSWHGWVLWREELQMLDGKATTVLDLKFRCLCMLAPWCKLQDVDDRYKMLDFVTSSWYQNQLFTEVFPPFFWAGDYYSYKSPSWCLSPDTVNKISRLLIKTKR